MVENATARWYSCIKKKEMTRYTITSITGGTIMTIEEMIEQKNELGYSYEQIAELSGVPLSTVQKVLGGITKSPRYETKLALGKVLQPKEALRVSEAAHAYGQKRQGEYTIEDYYALPDEMRAELIDGVLYDMATPAFIHQMIVMQISVKLANYIKEKGGKCIPLGAPFDTQLDCDNRTMVQPDVMVICDRDKIRKNKLFGAPDFIVEVLSPSTKHKDRSIKLDKYMAAGVREYWIVDPDKKHITVYTPSAEWDYEIEMYTFEMQVPVAIFDNECVIDFKEIYEYIEFMYETP